MVCENEYFWEIAMPSRDTEIVKFNERLRCE